MGLLVFFSGCSGTFAMDPTGFSPSSGPWKNYLIQPASQTVLVGSGQEVRKSCVQILTATFKLCALSDSEPRVPCCEEGRQGMSQGVSGRTTLDNIESFQHDAGML